MHKPAIVLLAACALLSPAAALAQSTPNFTRGFVPTAAQWNSYFAGKQDVLGFTSLNKAGDTMTGKLVTAASGASATGLNMQVGVAPSAPNDGDVWFTAAGIFVRANGLTVGPLSQAAGSTNVTVGASAITGGVSGRVLYDNAGVLGELPVTGTGSAVLATSPALVTPSLGAAAATSVNKVALTAPANLATLTIVDGKTFTASNTISLSGVDGSSVNVGNGGTLGALAYASQSLGTSGNAVPLLNGNNIWNGTINLTGLGLGTTGDVLCYDPVTGLVSYNAFMTCGGFTTAGTGTVLVLSTGATSTNATLAGTLNVTGISTATPGDVLCYNPSGGLVSYNTGASACTASSVRFKVPAAAVDEGAALAGIMAIAPGAYRYKPGMGAPGEHIGLYAEEVCEVDERLCVRDADGAVATFDQRGVLALLVAAVREQQREIERMRVR